MARSFYRRDTRAIRAVFVTALAGLALAAYSAGQTGGSNPYVGGAVCADCHQGVAERYAATPMARSFGAVHGIEDAPELEGGAFFHEGSQQRYSFETDNQPRLKRTEAGIDEEAFAYEASVDYWFGSGNHARSYLSRTGRGELVELPVTWYADGGGSWAMSPGYERPDHAGFSRQISRRCMFCHNADPGGDEKELRFPASLPQGIDCERCHGPGGAHVEAARTGADLAALRAAIVNPARLSPDRGMEVCLQCHLETTSLRLPGSLLRPGREVFSYRPGQALADYILHFDRPAEEAGERFEFASSGHRLLLSRCYAASGGALTCTTCHSPHGESSSESGSALRREACLGCHSPGIEQRTAAGAHPAGADCASCHMPQRRPADAIHVSVADHAILRNPPQELDALVERHDGNTPPYRGAVEPFYPREIQDDAGRVMLAVAQVKHDADLDGGIAQLETALANQTPQDGEAYLELAEALRRAGQLERSLTPYEKASELSPNDWPTLLRRGTALAESGDVESSAVILERARRAAPEEPAVLEAISDLLARRGAVEQTIAVLREAVRLDPLSSSARGKLGARLYQTGDAAGAEREWREAVRLRPESASHRLNLANLLASQGRGDEALPHFRAAARSGDDAIRRDALRGISLLTP